MSHAYKVWALVVAVVFVVAGCGDGSDGGAAADGKIAVVASTNVWGSVAEAVGGSEVSVRSLIDDPSADPHGYTDKPEDATLLAEAKVVVYNGGGYDDFFPKLVDAAGPDAKRVVAFDVSGYGEGNEHVWYDLPTVKKVADKIAAELGAASPEHKDTFTANATSFGTKLDDLEAQAAAIGGGKVVATEPVAHYLLKAAGMTDATPAEFSEAIEEETDPPVAAAAETTDLITNKQVVALINNAQTETAVTNSLVDAANGAGIPVVDVTETLPEGVTDYVEWMTDEVTALAKAVAGT
jgi:zinc/manganese transport system substrate-binding protein